MNAISKKNIAIKLALNCLYFSQIYKLLRPVAIGSGVCFVLHNVVQTNNNAAQNPKLDSDIFIKNQISTAFLESIITLVRDEGFEIVTLDEAHSRLLQGQKGTRFACFTFDDGYSDNYEIAMPVFLNARAPFTVFLIGNYLLRKQVPWRAALPVLFSATDTLSFQMNGTTFHFDLVDVNQRGEALRILFDILAGPPEQQEDLVAQLIDRYDVDLRLAAENSILGPASIRAMRDTGLVEFGAHSMTHCNLRLLPEQDMRCEMRDSRRYVENVTGREVRHFAYPGGRKTHAAEREFTMCRDLGFMTGWTTQHGHLTPNHSKRLNALPRISLNGHFQHRRYVDVFLSGATNVLYSIANRLGFEAS